MTELTPEARLAVLESKVDTLLEMKETVDELHDEFTKYKGFVGGIIFICSGIGVFFSVFGTWALKKMGI